MPTRRTRQQPKRPYTPDAALKQLSALAGLAVLQFLAPGAIILEILPTELPRNPPRAGAVYLVLLANGVRCLVDLVFQTRWEARTPLQLMGYAAALLMG